MNRVSLLAAAALAALSVSAAAAVGRSADISVYDRASGRNLPVYWHEGKAWVVGKPGNEYSVVIRNRRGEDLLAVVSVDGVNVVTGQAASPDQAGYVLGPGERTAIRGWRKTLDEVASFYFTSLGDSYAARTGRPENVGVIGVALFERARRPEPQAIAPEDRLESRRKGGEAGAAEAPSLQKRAAPSAPLGTGHGPREASRAQYAEFERDSRHPVETIAIHYDSYRNLVARGVLTNYGGRRDPDPFPGAFVPDPAMRRF